MLPILGRGRRAIAMDTRGFGDSDPLPPEAVSIEGWARAVLDLADALGLERFAVGGHHTGAVIALELAACAPGRISALALSAMSYVDADRRARHGARRVIDEVTARPDGGHLTELWARRAPEYPADRAIALLNALVEDALKAGPMAALGHRVVNSYRMEERIGRVACPTLVLAPKADPHAYPSARRVAAAIGGAELVEIEGAMVPFPDQMPEVFAAALAAFLDRLPG